MTHLRHKKDNKIEHNIIENARNLFRLKKEVDVTPIKDIRNHFRQKNKIRKSNKIY